MKLGSRDSGVGIQDPGFWIWGPSLDLLLVGVYAEVGGNGILFRIVE